MRCERVFNCELVGLETFKGCPSGPAPYFPPLPYPVVGGGRPKETE